MLSAHPSFSHLYESKEPPERAKAVETEDQFLQIAVQQECEEDAQTQTRQLLPWRKTTQIQAKNFHHRRLLDGATPRRIYLQVHDGMSIERTNLMK